MACPTLDSATLGCHSAGTGHDARGPPEPRNAPDVRHTPRFVTVREIEGYWTADGTAGSAVTPSARAASATAPATAPATFSLKTLGMM